MESVCGTFSGVGLAKSVTDCNIEQSKIIVFVEVHRKISIRKNIFSHISIKLKSKKLPKRENVVKHCYNDTEVIILGLPEYTEYKL